MSGHSKWHNIQKTKGAADAKRSQIFTKIAREMIVAVKTGGSGDPNNNSRLATVIAKAKAANMPNDNIKRTIDKALGSGNADSYENVVYEGYGPSGVAVIVDALTDNRNRTAPEVRHLLDKYGKGLGATGCVSWSFDRKGVIIIEKEDLDEDTVMMDALDAGADDMQVEEETFEVYTDPDASAPCWPPWRRRAIPSSRPPWRWCLRTMSSWKMRTTSRTWRSSLICWRTTTTYRTSGTIGIRSNFRHSKRRSGFVQTSCLFITLPRKIRPAI